MKGNIWDGGAGGGPQAIQDKAEYRHLEMYAQHPVFLIT
jgi:hypothetical protein